ncbi:MAG TPA: sigma 54-interacting transcriptional regulator [Symbiobacteriaceae bacterium]|jgi:PAS domain S-box-containing protein|nr:sigma 54-interacting transcriptional regulator [Symbiobacteriaceae bacterium]
MIQDLLKPAEQLLAILHDGVAAIDEHGIVVYANEANTRITGLKPADILGRHVSQAVPGSHLLEVLQTQQPIIGVRTRVNEREVVSNIVPVHREGRLVGVVSVFRDLSEVQALSNQLQEARNTIDLLRTSMSAVPAMDGGVVIGRSPLAQKVFTTAYKAATVDSPVLLEGESGTGKEVVARLIHTRSSRRDRPLIAVNCAAIPANLLESELFGHEEGAFTGARRGGRAGLFEMAEGGTLFLDEIGDMELSLQAKLLRALQSGETRRVGGERTHKVNVRIISATNRNLLQLVKEKQFREDLYYRLRVIRLDLPPLRQRREDLMLFLENATERICARLGRPTARYTPAALRVLLAHPWPGNIRELENVVEQAVVLAETDVIDAEDLPMDLAPLPADEPAALLAGTAANLAAGLQADAPGQFPTLEQMERALLEAAVRTFDSKVDLARHLGLSRATLYRKLARYGLD